MNRAIAFFDFDGTITTKDSLAEFIRFTKGSKDFLLGLVPVVPHIIGFKLGLLDRQKAKEKLLAVFFQGIPEKKFREQALSFVTEKIPAILRPDAVTQLEWHKKQGHEVVIVSASPTHWIEPWCDLHGFTCISTELEVVDHKITGNIVGLNCHGEEKVRRILEKYDLPAYDEVFAYGDTRGDKPMLALAGKSYYKPFRNPRNQD